MQKMLVKLVLILSLSCTFLYSEKSQAMDAKGGAILLMAGYGTIGGALLGTASLAFGSEGRTVAKGASIGLYCGLIFGGYIVLSHQLRQNRMNNPEPVPETDETYDEEGVEGIFGYNPRKTLLDFKELSVASSNLKLSYLGGETQENSVPPLAINILSLEF